MLDFPSERKIHRRPTPRLGGLAVFIAFAASTAVDIRPGRLDQMMLLLAGAAAFSVIGLLDDLRNAGAWKLGLEAAVVVTVVRLGGVNAQLPWPYAGEILAVLWILGVANALNCFDCADGVAAGTVAVTALMLIPLAVFWARPGVGVAAAALAGAVLGFLPYNFSSGRIFLGNNGSLMLGFLVAALPGTLIPSREHHAALVSWIAPILLLGVPVGDFLLVHVRRYRNGLRNPLRLMTSTGKDHLPHRLLNAGWSARQTAFWLYGATGLAGASAVGLVLAGPIVAAFPLAVLLTTGVTRWVAWASAKSV